MPAVGEDNSVLLSNGKRMPLVGLGTWQSEDEEIVVALNAAIDAGYRHIDTAFVYHNEKAIGDALKEVFCSGKIKREDMFIVTKLPLNGNRKEFVRDFFMKSLNNLQLEYVDLYLIHCPISTIKQDDEKELFPVKDGQLLVDTEVDLVETWKELEKLVDEGLARAIGVSNFNSVQIQRIYDNARIKPANVQVECHAFLAQVQLFEFCKKLNITLTGYSPIGSPGLEAFAKKKYGVVLEEKDKPPKLLDNPVVCSLAEKYKKTPAQILIRFLTQRRIVAIPKSVNPKRIAENIQVFDFSLSDEDMKTLLTLDGTKRYFEFTFHPKMKEHPDYPFNIPF